MLISASTSELPASTLCIAGCNAQHRRLEKRRKITEFCLSAFLDGPANHTSTEQSFLSFAFYTQMKAATKPKYLPFPTRNPSSSLHVLGRTLKTPICPISQDSWSSNTIPVPSVTTKKHASSSTSL